MDDISLLGDIPTLEKDITKIIEVEATTGLRLNVAKCEIIMKNFTLIARRKILNDFIKVSKEEMTLF